MTDAQSKPYRLVVRLLILAVLLLALNIAMTGLLLRQHEAFMPVSKSTLPCEAVPVRFVLDEPQCADKLLKAMNVTRVRVWSRGNVNRQ